MRYGHANDVTGLYRHRSRFDRGGNPSQETTPRVHRKRGSVRYVRKNKNNRVPEPRRMATRKSPSATGKRHAPATLALAVALLLGSPDVSETHVCSEVANVRCDVERARGAAGPLPKTFTLTSEESRKPTSRVKLKKGFLLCLDFLHFEFFFSGTAPFQVWQKQPSTCRFWCFLRGTPARTALR